MTVALTTIIRPLDPFEAIVRYKEAGSPNTLEQLTDLIRGAVSKEVSEDLLVRWLRAVKQHDMNSQELADYTLALAHSGKVLDWGSHASAGKHAPGGVAENTSGPVDAIVAACGVYAPIYTGKRLMHTPGTVDRYGSIPGFKIFLSSGQFKRQIESIGMAMTGQGPDCAPGDGLIYALREKVELVQVQALIVGSVLSKKIASGAKNFGVLMTFGEGALLCDATEALSMANRMQGVAKFAGARISSSPVSLHAPLGDHISTTALAVKECIRLLRNEDVAPDLREAVLRVASTMLLDTCKADTIIAARELAERTLSNGNALTKFQEFIAAQGGDPRCCEDLRILPQSESIIEIRANESGYVVWNPRALGQIANSLAGEFGSSEFDPGAGIVLSSEARYGSYLSRGALLATIYCKQGWAARAEQFIRTLALVIDNNRPAQIPRFYEQVLSN